MAANDKLKLDDLRDVDLSQLNLDHVDLNIDEPRSPVWRWLALALLAVIAGVVIWFPTTSTYQMLSPSSWLFFTICGVAVVVGVSVGRWLWEWVLDVGSRYAVHARRSASPAERAPRPASAVRRALILLFLLGSILVILIGVPDGEFDNSGAISSYWFLAAIGGVVVGVLMGRWILMQAEAQTHKARQSTRARLPSGFKWASLAVIVGLAAIALVAPLIVGEKADRSLEFAVGAIGLVVGVSAAIWLAHRFDETEQKLRQKARQQRPPF